MCSCFPLILDQCPGGTWTFYKNITYHLYCLIIYIVLTILCGLRSLANSKMVLSIYRLLLHLMMRKHSDQYGSVTADIIPNLNFPELIQVLTCSLNFLDCNAFTNSSTSTVSSHFGSAIDLLGDKNDLIISNSLPTLYSEESMLKDISIPSMQIKNSLSI